MNAIKEITEGRTTHEPLLTNSTTERLDIAEQMVEFVIDEGVSFDPFSESPILLDTDDGMGLQVFLCAVDYKTEIIEILESVLSKDCQDDRETLGSFIKRTREK